MNPSKPARRSPAPQLSALPFWTCLALAAAALAVGLRGKHQVRAQEPAISVSQP